MHGVPRHAATPDWTRFRERIVAGTAQDAIPRACELASSWLDLAPDERHARVAASIASEAQARFMLQALPLVRIGLRRDGGDEEARRIDATVSIDEDDTKFLLQSGDVPADVGLNGVERSSSC